MKKKTVYIWTIQHFNFIECPDNFFLFTKKKLIKIDEIKIKLRTNTFLGRVFVIGENETMVTFEIFTFYSFNKY